MPPSPLTPRTFSLPLAPHHWLSPHRSTSIPHRAKAGAPLALPSSISPDRIQQPIIQQPEIQLPCTPEQLIEAPPALPFSISPDRIQQLGIQQPGIQQPGIHRPEIQQRCTREQLIDAFRIFDPSATGLLSRDAFVRIMTRKTARGSAALSPTQAEQVFEAHDEAGRGVIMYREVAAAWAEPWRGAAFVPLSRLKQHGSLPRCGSNGSFAHPLTGEPNTNLAMPRGSFDSDKTVFVFVSHRWLGEGQGAAAHPDDPQRSKHKAIIEFGRQLRAGGSPLVPPDFEVALWIDFCCFDQDASADGELYHLHDIVASCDLVFTPLLNRADSADSSTVVYPSLPLRSWSEYRSAPFYEYLSRGWCRMEMLMGRAYEVKEPARGRLFRGALGNAVLAGRRPHMLYGCHEVEAGMPPLLLPPLSANGFERYTPEAGAFSREEDREAVRRMSQRTRSKIVPMPSGYDPEMPYRGGRGKAGCGRFYSPNGDVYEGAFKSDKRSGRGVLRTAAGAVYDGEWRKGRREGRGVYTSASGDVYDGEWHDDDMHGHGTLALAAGGAYEGNFAAGRFEGHGRLTFADGGVYEGEWHAGEREGYGEFVYADGRSYKGAFAAGKKHGQGTFLYPDGRVYCGEYVADKREGTGTFRYADGRSYEGGWRDGHKEGRGVLTHVDGRVLYGEWESDRQVREGVLFAADQLSAWQVLDGRKQRRRIPLEDAMLITEKLRLAVSCKPRETPAMVVEVA